MIRSKNEYILIRIQLIVSLLICCGAVQQMACPMTTHRGSMIKPEQSTISHPSLADYGRPQAAARSPYKEIRCNHRASSQPAARPGTINADKT